MSIEAPPSKRIRMSDGEVDRLSKEEIIVKLKEAEGYIASLEGKLGQNEDDDLAVDRLKQQQIEATRRENVLVMRLTAKEQEVQEYINQIQELKQAQSPSTSQLRSMLLDPAINLMFQRMKKEMDAGKEKLEQSQNELSAWKFTPDSQTGKRLMSRCRMLLTENEELGKVMSAGRIAKLEGEIALEKKLVNELKSSQAETDEFLVELDEDVEGMQSTIFFLQQQLKETKDQLEAARKQEPQQQKQHEQESLSDRTTEQHLLRQTEWSQPGSTTEAMETDSRLSEPEPRHQPELLDNQPQTNGHSHRDDGTTTLKDDCMTNEILEPDVKQYTTRIVADGAETTATTTDVSSAGNWSPKKQRVESAMDSESSELERTTLGGDKYFNALNKTAIVEDDYPENGLEDGPHYTDEEI